MTSVFAIRNNFEIAAVEKSERNIVALGRRVTFNGFTCGCACSRTRCAWSCGCSPAVGTALWCANKFESFNIHAQFALLLAGLFIIPCVEAQTSFDQNRRAFPH